MDRSGSLGRINVIPKENSFATSLSIFKDRAKEYILVDKTQAIADFLTEKRPIHCVLRPRRSGKTTMITMFHAFFEAGKLQDVQERRAIFKDLNLKIYNTDFFEPHFAQYNVVFINLSDVRDVSNKEEFDEYFTWWLSKEVERHNRLGHFNQVKTPEDLEFIHAVTYRRSDTKIKMATILYNLSRILYESTNRKALVLVDEYDTPVSSAMNQEVYTYAERILRRTFGTLLHIFPLTPGQSLYGDTCLFTEAEVKALFDHVKTMYPKLSFTFNELRDWYEGYVGADQKLYNPWTICRALVSRSLQTFWNDTGNALVLVKHIFGAGRKFHLSFSRLLSGNPFKVTLKRRLYPISFSQLNPSDIFGVLHFAGYLTEVKPDMFEVPNREIFKEYLSWICYHSRTLSRDPKMLASASAVVTAAMTASIARFRTVFHNCFEKDHVSAVTLAFFEMGSQEDVEKRRNLFFALPSLISTSPMFETYFAQHPVIHIDMSSVVGTTYEEMRENFDFVVRKEFVRQHVLGNFEGLSGFLEEVVQAVLSGKNMQGSHAFEFLAEALYQSTTKKVIVLIDEYDTPIVDSSANGYRKQALHFIAQVYARIIKNTNGILHGTLILGILRIQQTGFMSGFNNLDSYTLDSTTETEMEIAYSKAFLFTSEEVEILYNQYNKFPFTLRKLKQWYGGHLTSGGIELFNPWSICCALEKRTLKGYWTASGVDNVILRHIIRCKEFQGAFAALLDGTGVEIESPNPKVGIEDEMDVDDILEMLYFSGYLTKNGEFLKIPNLELQATFFAWVKKTSSKERNEAAINKNSRAMFDACISAPPATFSATFEKYIEKHGPAKYGHNEDKYHNYILCALQHGSSGRFTVQSETGGGHGRMDILIEEIGGMKAAILELKAWPANSKKRPTVQNLKSLANKALEQIETKKYRAGLDDPIVELREYGIALFGKKIEICTAILRRESGGDWKVM
ncbi:hypothetical protein EW145_g2164 [Phellinidium pouzarii]|uniref:AAA-ATPase-like domain-containing protein n=1 Tax=Phellinidium pouzarii TaxID=167371 RepID=A0A4S4LHG6_9AGAM|nr:hypothetical protein EW145_g2164 [Phellinidium pouzarii]